MSEKVIDKVRLREVELSGGGSEFILEHHIVEISATHDLQADLDTGVVTGEVSIEKSGEGWVEAEVIRI